MKFKKLFLQGFKSFANKLDIKFGEGITGIVGPNGCGKSNVADAVRWVLGEQSSKLLRGNNMQDVIFSGTKKRKSLSYAEVALTFDNKNKSLFPSYDFEEVVISRKLFRSGESEYYINGALCRLRDISEMLRDGGFAREGYTIIGQGRVTELINSKPEERRAIFEEAAGISKYKFKKIEAERRNERTRANLERIDIDMKGDHDRLEPLTRQAEKARQALELKEKLKYHEINYYISSYESAADIKAKLSAVIDEINLKIEAKQAEYDRASEEYNSAMGKLQTIDSDLNALHAEMLDLSVDKEKMSGQIGMLTMQLNNLNKQNETLISANAVLSQNYNDLTRTADAKQIEYEGKSAKLESAKAEFDTLNAAYLELDKKVAEQESRIEAERRSLLAAMERRAAVSMSIGELNAERAAVKEHIEDLTARIAAGSEAIATVTVELAENSAELEKLASDKAELISQKELAAAESATCAERLHAVTEELTELKRDLSVADSRRGMLAELQSSMEGYAIPVRKLLADAKKSDRLANAVMGVVGQIISVKEGFETAIEMALGSAVSNIVTRTEDDAKILVEHLKQNRYGRATFLPLSSFKPRLLEEKYSHLLSMPGCFGVATESVTADRVYDTVVSGLLGGTVLVDNMDTAVTLARASGYGFRIVTLDGEVIYPQGSITGGSKKSDASNVFSHERELNEISAQVDKLRSDIDAMSAERETLTANDDRLRKRIRELTEDIHECDLVEASGSAENSRLKDELDKLNETKATDSRVLDEFIAREEALAADINAVESDDVAFDTAERTEQDERKHREFEALRAERDVKRDEVSAKNLEIVTLGKDTDTLQLEIARLKSEAVSTAQNIENNDMAILGNNRTMQECNEKIRALSSESATGNENRRRELAQRLENLSDFKSELNNKAVENDKLRIECNDEISRLTDEKHTQEISLTRVDSDMDAMQQRVQEEYGLVYEDCLQFKDENYDVEAGSIEIAKLKRRINNLGNINPDAIEESKVLQAKYMEKERQRDDLVKSLADEERVIKEMSANMLRDFNECFEKIRENFRSIFCELFNGGTADLELTENEDPLLCGVEIKAQPPSKNLQSISLLSGGEKTLTAIAILFAILKLRPMPFCLLDEIEAALDDANVGRFAQYLKKFSSDTQFIVITHRKPTMEQADCLYGVTMQEEGVSSIVSVRLADAIAEAVSVSSDDQD